MRILIKCHSGTYALMDKGGKGNHIGSYHNFLHYNVWKKQGHQVEFIGEELIPDNWQDYDILFFRGYNSFRQEYDFSVKILKEFKGKKILYIEGGDEKNIGQLFDTVFVPELSVNVEKWKVKYPKKDVRPIAWTSPEFDLIDKGDNPYPDKKFRIIYTGIFTNRFLDNLKELAKRGEYIALGGIYYDGKICRHFTVEEMKGLHPNIQIIGKQNGIFTFGEQFPYLRYADLAICFYAYPKPGGLSSKLTEYLVCGLPVVCEHSTPNSERVIQYDAGLIVDWNNLEMLYNAIQHIKATKYDKQQIQNKARYFHNPEKICKEILL